MAVMIRRRAWMVALAALTSPTASRSITRSLFNPDELFSIYLAKQDWNFILGYAWHADTNPPVHTVLVKLWSQAFGYSEIAATVVSLLGTAAAVPVVFSIARACRLQSFRHRALSSLLFLLSTTVAFYSLDARPYSIWLLFTSVSMLGLVKLGTLLRAAESPPAKQIVLASLLYAVGAVAAVYTHLTTVPYIAAGNVTFLWMWLRDRPSRALPKLLIWGALQAALLLAILPQLLISASQLDSHILDWIPPTKVANLPRPVVEVIAGNYSGNRLIVVVPLVLVTIGTWLVTGWRQRRVGTPLELLFILSASGFVVILVLSLVRPLLVAHTFAWLLIPVSVVNASPSTWTHRRLGWVFGLGLDRLHGRQHRMVPVEDTAVSVARVPCPGKVSRSADRHHGARGQHAHHGDCLLSA